MAFKMKPPGDVASTFKLGSMGSNSYRDKNIGPDAEGYFLLREGVGHQPEKQRFILMAKVLPHKG